MKPFLRFLLVLFLSGCGNLMFSGPRLSVVREDFGPEGVTAPWPGAGAADRTVIVHHGPTSLHAGACYVNVTEAMLRLRAEARRLPAGDPARQRMSATYGRLYHFYRTRRDAMMATPFPAYGRGGVNRAAMMPLMPLTL